jgi:hypothetical protein
MKRLKVDCYCEGIHGVTGRVYEAGILPAGTLVRNVVASEGEDVDGAYELMTFEASTDGGQCWYKQRTFGTPGGLVEEEGQ